MSLATLSRLRLWTPRLNTARTFVNQAASRPVPPAREAESISTPLDFLKAIGREADTKYTPPETWEEFWKTADGRKLRTDGVATKDRRYLLWCMEKYRQGHSVQDFAHQPKPPKKVRGWGPKVQNGKRIRSKRIKAAPPGQKYIV